MKKTNKFLLLALILIGATNQVSFCMRNKEEVVEIEEKEQEKVVRKEAKEEVRKEIKTIVAKISEEINAILYEKKSSPSTNSSTNPSANQRTIIKIVDIEKEEEDEKKAKKAKQIKIKINLEDISFLKKSHKALGLEQKNALANHIYQAEKGDCTVKIQFEAPFLFGEKYTYLDPKTIRKDTKKRYPDITINRENIGLLATNLLDKVIDRKTIAMVKIKKTYGEKLTKLITIAAIILPAILTAVLSNKYFKVKNYETLDRRVLTGISSYSMFIFMLILNEFVFNCDFD